MPPNHGDNRTVSVIYSLGAYNEAAGENPDGAAEALGGFSVPKGDSDILNQAMDEHEAKWPDIHTRRVMCGDKFVPMD